MYNAVPVLVVSRTISPSTTFTPFAHLGESEASKAVASANFPPEVSVYAPPLGRRSPADEIFTITFD